jgi:hypothetical protein
VPAEAIWAGGGDGGDWLLCVMRGKEPVPFFDCEVYSDHTGSLTTRGRYSFAKADPDGEWKLDNSPLPRLSYRFFDGVIVHLDGPYALVPDGEIDYPFGDGHGKRVKYRFGRETGGELSY